MHSKKPVFACGLSLAAVAILVPLVSPVNHLGKNSQPGVNARQLQADANPIPPLPPQRGAVQATEALTADANPIPPLPPHKKTLIGLETYIADANPIPPLPPPKGHGKSAAALV